MIGHHRCAAWALTAAALVLAGCQKTEDKTAAAPAQVVGAETRTTATAAPSPAETATNGATPGSTAGGDDAQIQLSGLTLADHQANPLGGELSCNFRAGGPDPLLSATGVSGVKEAAHGLVKVAGSVERIVAPGGWDAMVGGTTFTGAGKTIVIALTGKATGGGESPAYPATLTYQRTDGAKRVIAGTWTCGA